jgi:catechol 2,3-dioxygenase-like lactoylglutathione lyase family enzyme
MVQLSHRGICVSDINASERFYSEALDFVEYQDYGLIQGPDMTKTMQLPDVRVYAKMLKHPGGQVIEFLNFVEPAASGPQARRSPLQYGLFHLCFYVDDVDAQAARITAAGGHVLDHTRAHIEAANVTMLNCTDPDGVRIELVSVPGETPRFSHSGICVQDLDISMKYYAALGFQPAESFTLEEAFIGDLNELPGLKMRGQMIRDAAGNAIELLKVTEPAASGSRERQPLNRFGLTHMAFWDDEMERTVVELTDRKGYFAEEAHVRTPTIELQHGADPDGIRIELMRPVSS